MFIMELKETVEMMCSEDYKERFKAEYYQCIIRYNKLVKMLYEYDTNTLPFKLSCPRSTYDLQVDGMYNYIAILEARAAIEGIELDNLRIES